VATKLRPDHKSGLIDEIRRATNGNFALGNEHFAADVSAALGRLVAAGKVGRPRKVAMPESGVLL